MEGFVILEGIYNGIFAHCLVCSFYARNYMICTISLYSCEGGLAVYIKVLESCLPRIPPNSLSKAHGVIEMPIPTPELLIFEPFIETDEIIFSPQLSSGNTHDLRWKGESRWVEITVGVIGKRGSMRSLTPSITVKESGDILSLEEKFQGGTGINLTPPPLSIISNEALEKCKKHIELIANTLQLKGFSRIDVFVNVDSGDAHGMIEMPIPTPELLIFEPFIETDEINFSPLLSSGNTHDLRWKGDSRWVEISVGVV